MNAEALLERFRPRILSSLAGGGRNPRTLRLECLTARRRAGNGDLLGYDLNVLLDPELGVPCDEPNAEPRWAASSAYVLFLDAELEIPLFEECDDPAVGERVLADARARQAAGAPRVPGDAGLRVKSCQRIRQASTGRLIGYRASVVVDENDRRAKDSNPLGVFLDPDGARPSLERVDLS